MKTLVCRKCKEQKPATKFSVSRNVTRGYRYTCKDCDKLRNDLLETRKTRDKTYQKKREKINEYVNEYNRTEEGKLKLKFNALKYKYGITEEEYNKLYLSQNGKCAICGCDISLLGNDAHLDHDHTSKKNRGLLCKRCNLGLGFLNTEEILIKAQHYISIHS